MHSWSTLTHSTTGPRKGTLRKTPKHSRERRRFPTAPPTTILTAFTWSQVPCKACSKSIWANGIVHQTTAWNRVLNSELSQPSLSGASARILSRIETTGTATPSQRASTATNSPFRCRSLRRSWENYTGKMLTTANACRVSTYRRKNCKTCPFWTRMSIRARGMTYCKI